MLRLFLALLITVLVAACGDSQDPTPTATMRDVAPTKTAATPAPTAASSVAAPSAAPASNTPAAVATSTLVGEYATPTPTALPYVVHSEYAPAPAEFYFTTQLGFGAYPRLLAEGDTVWIATNIGVFAWDLAANTYTFYGSEHGLVANKGNESDVMDVALSADGSLWISTYQGIVRRLPDGTWRDYGIPVPEAGSRNSMSVFGDVVAAHDGSEWFGTKYKGLLRWLPEDQWTSFTADNSGLADGHVSGLALAPDGALAVLTYGAIQRVTNLEESPEFTTVATDINAPGPYLQRRTGLSGMETAT